MASSSKRRQTMAKMNRERAVKEKRALKQEKKEARKQAAAEAQNGESPEMTIAEDAPLDPIASDEGDRTRADRSGASAAPTAPAD
jgi:hypothetical protein